MKERQILDWSGPERIKTLLTTRDRLSLWLAPNSRCSSIEDDLDSHDSSVEQRIENQKHKVEDAETTTRVAWADSVHFNRVRLL